MADTNIARQADFTIRGTGVVTPPDGMSVQDMERLAREADERRLAQED